MSKKVVVGKDGDSNSYCIRILEDGETIDSPITLDTQAQLYNSDNNTISPVRSFIALTKFSEFWKEYNLIPDDVLQIWLAKAIQITQ